MLKGRTDHLFDLTARQQSTPSSRAGILRLVVCIGVALSQPPLARAQDAVPSIAPEPTVIPELSKRKGPEPLKVEATSIPDTEGPSIEILAGTRTPSEKPAPVVKPRRTIPRARAQPRGAQP